MTEKRKTWKDRRCEHGKPPVWRHQIDLSHCDTPGCYDAALAQCGLQRLAKADPDASREPARGEEEA